MREEQKKTLIIFLVVGFTAGIVLTGIGYGKWRTYRLGSPHPHELSVAELSSSGPPRNRHVRLHDCSPTVQYVRLGLKDSANFSRVWQPLVVAGAPGTKPRAVVLTSDDILDEKKMGPLWESTIDGLVVEDDQELPDEARRQMASLNPGLDFTSPVVVEVNGYPSRAKVYGLFGGGILLLLLALGSVAGFVALRWVQQMNENASPPPRSRPAGRRRRDDFD